MVSSNLRRFGNIKMSPVEIRAKCYFTLPMLASIAFRNASRVFFKAIIIYTKLYKLSWELKAVLYFFKYSLVDIYFWHWMWKNDCFRTLTYTLIHTPVLPWNFWAILFSFVYWTRKRKELCFFATEPISTAYFTEPTQWLFQKADSRFWVAKTFIRCNEPGTVPIEAGLSKVEVGAWFGAWQCWFHYGVYST